MATLRTPEEKKAIILHCIELEKAGGDILEYLRSENYMTPRATWCNIQRQLGRKPNEFTTGQPDERREKKIVNTKQKLLTNEQRAETVRIAIEGGNPRKYIEELGFMNPDGVWYNVKQWYKKHEPSVYDKIPRRICATQTVDKGMPKKTGPDGKEYEKLELDGGKNYQVSVAETPEAPKITEPVNFGGYEVTAIRDKNLGEFYYDHDHNCVDWRTGLGDEISLSIDGWKMLIERLPQIMGVLGVQV